MATIVNYTFPTIQDFLNYPIPAWLENVEYKINNINRQTLTLTKDNGALFFIGDRGENCYKDDFYFTLHGNKILTNRGSYFTTEDMDPIELRIIGFYKKDEYDLCTSDLIIDSGLNFKPFTICVEDYYIDSQELYCILQNDYNDLNQTTTYIVNTSDKTSDLAHVIAEYHAPEKIANVCQTMVNF